MTHSGHSLLPNFVLLLVIYAAIEKHKITNASGELSVILLIRHHDAVSMSMAQDPKIIRDLIKHENALMNDRMGWFLTLQGFLFAGLAFAWDKGTGISIVFSVVGVLSSMSIGILLQYGILALKRLEEQPCLDSDGPIIGRGYGETKSAIHFLLPWHLLPVVFFVAWTFLIVIRVSVPPCG